MFKILAFVIATLLNATSAQARVVDAPADRDAWFDITVIKAHVRSDWILRSFDQVERCDKIRDEWVNEGRAGTNHYESFDCTRHIEGATQATAFKPLPVWTFRNGWLTTALESPLVEIYTVVPLDRMARATYLGFSESWMGGRVNLFKANGLDGRTHESGQVRLKDGRIGIVHRWIAVFQQNGYAAGLVLRSVPFKPVLVREENGDQLRYWDPLVGDGMFRDYVIANYRIVEGSYEESAPTVIDRDAELLQ